MVYTLTSPERLAKLREQQPNGASGEETDRASTDGPPAGGCHGQFAARNTRLPGGRIMQGLSKVVPPNLGPRAS
jgi:hypothetical protein